MTGDNKELHPENNVNVEQLLEQKKSPIAAEAVKPFNICIYISVCLNMSRWDKKVQVYNN